MKVIQAEALNKLPEFRCFSHSVVFVCVDTPDKLITAFEKIRWKKSMCVCVCVRWDAAMLC